MENKIQNEEQLVKLASVETVEELNKALEELGITLEEGVTAEQFLETLKAGDAGELAEDDLEAVAGGVIITPAIIIAATALGISVARYLRNYYRKRR